MTKFSFLTRMAGMAGAIAVACSLVACSEIDEYQNQRQDRNHQAGQAWLSDHMDVSRIDVSGQWKSDSDDWGTATLIQHGRNVEGHMGDYDVKGVVSGDKAYLLAGSDGWYSYCVVLEMPTPNLMIGYTSHSVPYTSDGRENIRLDRVQN